MGIIRHKKGVEEKSIIPNKIRNIAYQTRGAAVASSGSLLHVFFKRYGCFLEKR